MHARASDIIIALGNSRYMYHVDEAKPLPAYSKKARIEHIGSPLWFTSLPGFVIAEPAIDSTVNI